MKKTIKKVVPIALFMLTPCLSVICLNAENNELRLKINIHADRSSCVLKTAGAGNIIVRNVIRK